MRNVIEPKDVLREEVIEATKRAERAAPGKIQQRRFELREAMHAALKAGVA